MHRATIFFLFCVASCSQPGWEAAPGTTDPPAVTPTVTQIEGAEELPVRTVALTFDDGPDVHTLELAQWLHDRGIPATFFVNGCNFATHTHDRCTSAGRHDFDPALLGQLVALGHRVANHTENHLDLTHARLTMAQELDELRTTQALLDPFITDGVYLFRPPQNRWSPALSQLLEHTRDLARLSGPIKYDDRGGDWACTDPKHFSPTLTPEQCADEYLKVQSPYQNGIFQLHDRNPNAPGSTYALDVTRALLARLDAMPGVRFRFVPLDALPQVHGTLRFGKPEVWSEDFADARLGDGPEEDALRFGDLDGDRRADACVRRRDGIWCALAGRVGFGAATRWSTDLSDANGWAGADTGGTLQLVDLDGDGHADLCARGADGLRCFRAVGRRFVAMPAWFVPGFADGAGWGAGESAYRSIHFGDVDGDRRPDVCARDRSGIVCSRFDGARFLALERWSGDFSDAAGFADASTGGTVQLADVDGDGRADVCARGTAGLVCALSTGHGFAAARLFTEALFSDGQGWAEMPSLYRSIHFADIDHDGRADVCGRAPEGVVCAFSSSRRFDRAHFVVNTDFRDATGWSPARYGATVQLADVSGDGRADLCGRGVGGLACALAP